MKPQTGPRIYDVRKADGTLVMSCDDVASAIEVMQQLGGQRVERFFDKAWVASADNGGKREAQ